MDALLSVGQKVKGTRRGRGDGRLFGRTVRRDQAAGQLPKIGAVTGVFELLGAKIA
jgi:hypothetical protein